MKGKLINRLLSGIVTAACVVTSLPVGVYAAEGIADPDEAVVEEYVTEDAEAADEDEAYFAEESVDEIVESATEETVETEEAFEEDEEAQAEADTVEKDADTVTTGGTEDNPQTINISECKDTVYELATPTGNEKYYYKFTLNDPGVMTFWFMNTASDPSFDETTFRFIDKAYFEGKSYQNYFDWRVDTSRNTFINYKSSESYFGWIDKNTIKFAFPKGTFILQVFGGGDSAPVSRFQIKDFTPLETVEGELPLIDTRIGGSND